MKTRFQAHLAALAVAISATLGGQSAQALTPSQWPDCNCPDALSTVLAAWDFEKMTSGVPYPSAPPSFVHPNVIATDLSGPGNVMASAPGGPGTNQWACFDGFPANGNAGSIGFKMTYTGSELLTLCGFSFDAFSEGVGEGLHGPTSLFVNVYANGTQVWQSESVSLTPGFNNQIHWDIENPDGNDLNGDGLSLTGGNFDWMQLTAGDTLAFEIVASGANTSLVGLDLDNVQVTACVPEPSGALLLMAAGMVLLVRVRRSHLLSV